MLRAGYSAQEVLDAVIIGFRVAEKVNIPAMVVLDAFVLSHTAEAVDIPICVYNIPGRTSKNIEPETIVQLAEVPGITMVKEATGQLDQASHILASTDLTVLSGDDSMTLPLLAIGGRGVISVVGNIIPQDMIAMIDAFERGDLAAAQSWHHKLFPLCRDMLGLATNPIPVKTAMAQMGLLEEAFRLPMVPPKPETRERLAQVLAGLGLRPAATKR